MNRRGFLGSMIGLVATAALPKPALALLEKTADKTDAEFILAAATDADWQALIEAKIRKAMLALCRAIDEEGYKLAIGINHVD